MRYENKRWHADMDRIQKNYAREQKYIPKSIKEKEVQNFTIKFTYDTQKIEGSTLTRRETADLLVNNHCSERQTHAGCA